MRDYRRVADAVAAQIAAGRLRPGDRLPTQRAFARRHGIADSTASRVYGELTRRGLVVGEVGRGTFVRAAPATAGPALTEPALGRVDLELNYPSVPGQSELLAAGLARLARPDVLEAALRPAGVAGHRRGPRGGRGAAGPPGLDPGARRRALRGERPAGHRRRPGRAGPVRRPGRRGGVHVPGGEGARRPARGHPGAGRVRRGGPAAGRAAGRAPRGAAARGVRPADPAQPAVAHHAGPAARPNWPPYCGRSAQSRWRTRSGPSCTRTPRRRWPPTPPSGSCSPTACPSGSRRA